MQTIGQRPLFLLGCYWSEPQRRDGFLRNWFRFLSRGGGPNRHRYKLMESLSLKGRRVTGSGQGGILVNSFGSEMGFAGYARARARGVHRAREALTISFPSGGSCFLTSDSGKVTQAYAEVLRGGGPGASLQVLSSSAGRARGERAAPPRGGSGGARVVLALRLQRPERRGARRPRCLQAGLLRSCRASSFSGTMCRQFS